MGVHSSIAGTTPFGHGQVVHQDLDTFTVQFRGPVGSVRTFRKTFRRNAAISAGEIDKIIGIAHRLPAPAFDALFDPETIELMLNPHDGMIHQEKLGEKDSIEVCPMEERFAEEFIRRTAGYLRRTITRNNPLLEGVLPLDDSRIAAQLPPVVIGPTFCIRKRAIKVFTLREYVDNGILSIKQCDFLQGAVASKKNILVVGGTSSGKTTFTNAILHEMTMQNPNERIIVIEDTAELNCAASNRVNFLTSEEVSISDLVRTTLRMRPDRIVVGEVRDRSAWDLLQAWNTGHPGGLSTIHCDDCVAGLRRLKSLVSMNPYHPHDIEPDIALAVDVMVHIERFGVERRIREIVEVMDYDNSSQETYGYRLVTH